MKCQRIRAFWEMVCKLFSHILGYKIPKNCQILYLCSSTEESVLENDIYLVKILLVASKKAVTRNWGRVYPLTKDQFLTVIKEINTMEKLHII